MTSRPAIAETLEVMLHSYETLTQLAEQGRNRTYDSYDNVGSAQETSAYCAWDAIDDMRRALDQLNDLVGREDQEITDETLALLSVITSSWRHGISGFMDGLVRYQQVLTDKAKENK